MAVSAGKVMCMYGIIVIEDNYAAVNVAVKDICLVGKNESKYRASILDVIG